MNETPTKSPLSKKVYFYILLIVLVAFAGNIIRKTCIYHSAMTDPAPSALTLQRINTDGKNGIENIKKLWNSNLIPQKLYAIDKTRENVSENRDVRNELLPIVLEALSDLDSGIKKNAINMIAYTYPQELPYLLPLLKDIDSEVRNQAARAIARKGNKGYTAYMIPLLDDPVLKNRITAANALKRWHGNDYGVRFNASKENISTGLDKWRNWYNKHKKEFTVPTVQPKSVPGPHKRVIAQDFTLPDLEGKPLTLSDIKTPVVMLYFWGEPEHGPVAPMKYLEAVQEEFPNELTLLPIAVDGVPKNLIGHQDENSCHDDKSSHDVSCTKGQTDPDALKKKIIDHWKTHGLKNTRCLIDDGAASFRYNSNNVPLTVLISDGIVKRRFEGPRSTDELKKMVKKLISH